MLHRFHARRRRQGSGLEALRGAPGSCRPPPAQRGASATAPLPQRSSGFLLARVTGKGGAGAAPGLAGAPPRGREDRRRVDGALRTLCNEGKSYSRPPAPKRKSAEAESSV